MRLLAFLLGIFLASTSFAQPQTFMPPNHLELEEAEGGINQAQFDNVINRVEGIYASMFKHLGGQLKVERRWTDSTVNAMADQNGDLWQVHMFGGLARRPEITEDGFAMVICHEIGHHLGGYPFIDSTEWAANEGQSDYYASLACAEKVFGVNLELAAKAQGQLPTKIKDLCDKAHPNNKDFCYRTMAASKSISDLLAHLEQSEVDFLTPDKNVVSQTDNAHPHAQCRLDTYMAGVLCGAARWDYQVIPGKKFSDRISAEAEADALKHSCANDQHGRPLCWFHSVQD